METLYLSTDEMEKIQDFISKKIFTTLENCEPIAVALHEKESEYVHTDIGILYPEEIVETDNCAMLHTLGMSAFKMENGRRCEILIEIPIDAFEEAPTCEICESVKSIWDILFPGFKLLIQDLIGISKLPAITNEVFSNCDTIQSASDAYFALLKISEIDETDIYYLVPMRPNDIKKLNSIVNMEDKERFIAGVLDSFRKSLTELLLEEDEE